MPAALLTCWHSIMSAGKGGSGASILGLWCAALSNQLGEPACNVMSKRLVTQVEFVELTKMDPLDLFILIEDGKLPIVKEIRRSI